MLINLQPFANPIRLEVCLGDERHPAGTALDCAKKLEGMRTTLGILAESNQHGLFVRREELNWSFEMRYTAAADWQEFVERPSFGSLEVDPDLLAAALERPDGCVISTEDDLAQSFGPISLKS